MKLRIASAALFACSILAAQEAQDPSKGEAKEITVTGCLTTGATTSLYIITEDATGKRMTVSAGSADLAKHANHKVKITGATETGKANHLTATKVEHVSDTCSSN